MAKKIVLFVFFSMICVVLLTFNCMNILTPISSEKKGLSLPTSVPLQTPSSVPTQTPPYSPSYAIDAIYPGVPIFDNNGNVVNSHSAGFIKVGDTYYMVGEQRSGASDMASGQEDSFTGVNMYSTKDFLHWNFVGTVVQPQPGTPVNPTYSGQTYCGERPKILYNALTGKYVIYIKMMYFSGGTAYASHVACTSSTLEGPYTYVCTLTYSGLRTGDYNVYQEGDTAYFCGNDGYLYQLSSDFLSLASLVKSGTQSGEGISLYKANGVYFWQSSGKTGWRANDDSYSTATSLTGTWTAHGYFCPSGTQTWQSQDSFVLPIVGSSATTYLYVGDRWGGCDLPSSTLVMLPMTVSGNTESINTFYEGWKINVSEGTWSPVDTNQGIVINDNTTGTGLNQFNYSGGWGYSTGQSGCYNNDIHSTSGANNYVTFAFTGTQIFLYTQFSNAQGFMGVTLYDESGSIAKTPEVHVSLYSSGSTQGNHLIYVSPIMPRATYILKARAFGTKYTASSSSAVSIDRVRIIEFPTPPDPTPTPVTTATPTPATNLALLKTATSDSNQTGHAPADGNDGNMTTRWCAVNGSTGHYWTVDLGSSYSLGGTEVDWETTNIYKYKIEVSTDNSTWSTAVDNTNNAVSTNINVDSFNTTGRYVKITVTGLPASTWASFYEFKVF